MLTELTLNRLGQFNGLLTLFLGFLGSLFPGPLVEIEVASEAALLCPTGLQSGVDVLLLLLKLLEAFLPFADAGGLTGHSEK